MTFRISIAAGLWLLAAFVGLRRRIAGRRGRSRHHAALGAALAGYYENRFNTGVHDDLHAKALVFE